MNRSGDTEAAIGARLRDLRAAAGLSQQAFAERVGARRQQVSKWERGVDRLAASQACAAASVLGVSVAELLGEPPPSSHARRLAALLDGLPAEASARLVNEFSFLARGAALGAGGAPSAGTELRAA